jgi:hypothetical protein
MVPVPRGDRINGLARHVMKPQTTVMPDCTCLPKHSVTVILSTLPRPPL